MVFEPLHTFKKDVFVIKRSVNLVFIAKLHDFPSAFYGRFKMTFSHRLTDAKDNQGGQSRKESNRSVYKTLTTALPFIKTGLHHRRSFKSKALFQTNQSIFGLFNQTIPLFLPYFRPKIDFPGWLYSCNVLRKLENSINREFPKKPMFTIFSTCSHHRVNLPSTYPRIDTR